MKRILIAVTLLLTIAATNTIKAQAWDKGAKVLTLGIGGSNFWHFNRYDASPYYYGYNSIFYRTSAQLHFQGDFGVHRYVGVGFSTGVGGAPGYRYYPGEVNFSLGVTANFHFYQLIEDKTSRDIHGDKLDIYAGLNLGSGVAALFWRNPDEVRPYALFYVGPQVGVRYYFTEHVGVYGEFGWGKSFISGGVAFRL